MTHLSKARVVRVLEKAIQKIKNVGWTTGGFRAIGVDGKCYGYCLSGAIQYSTKSARVSGAAYTMLQQVISEEMDRPNTGIVHFNDLVCNSADEAIRMLRKAKRRAAR